MACKPCEDSLAAQKITKPVVNIFDLGISEKIQRIKNSVLQQEEKYKGIIKAFQDLVSESEFSEEKKELIAFRLAICLSCPSYIDLDTHELIVLQQFIRLGLFSKEKIEIFGGGFRKKCSLCGCPCTKLLVEKDAQPSLRCPAGKW